MSLAAELWHAVERWNPLQKRAADGTWGDGAGQFIGEAGEVHIGRAEDGNLTLGIGSRMFSNVRDEADDSGDVFGHTARLNPAAVRELHARLSAAHADGKRRQVAADKEWEEHGTVPDHGDNYEIASGYVSGEGADVHYSVILDDYDVGVQTYLAAIPHSSDATLNDLWGAEQGAEFDAAEMRKLLARLGTAAGTTESAAVDLWRALEAWDAARHPRGPGGRFVKLGGGGGSDRPSLADAVRGTTAGDPKRQRADKGGMSVGDAVRSAARRSDSTGRPTQRTPAHHRAEGAHDVADEVERALADAGVPEAQRAEIAARARAVADGHGKRPSTKLADQDTRDLEDWLHNFGTEHRRSSAVQRELDRRKGTTTAAPPSTPQPKRAPSSAASRLAETPTHDLEAWLHQFGPDRPRSKAIMAELERRKAGRAAAGLPAARTGELVPPSTPAAQARAPRAAPARMDANRLVDVESRLGSATSTSQARQHLAGMTAGELRQIASFTQVAVGAGETKARMTDRIVDALVGRRLDAAAIDRMARR